MKNFSRLFISSMWAFALLLHLSACGGDDSKRDEPLSLGNSVEASQQEAKPKLAKGELVYRQYCQTCHQADGSGTANLNPPLKKTDWVVGDKNRLIKVILNGLAEEIEVNGQTYNNVMAPHDFLTNQQIADVLTYIRSNFGNDASAIDAEEVAALRE